MSRQQSHNRQCLNTEDWANRCRSGRKPTQGQRFNCGPRLDRGRYGPVICRQRLKRFTPPVQSREQVFTRPKDIMTNPAVRELLERSNRLGADPRNTNYAGGNTSAKGSETDPVTDRKSTRLNSSHSSI